MDILKNSNYAFIENVRVFLPQIKLHYVLNAACEKETVSCTLQLMKPSRHLASCPNN